MNPGPAFDASSLEHYTINLSQGLFEWGCLEQLKLDSSSGFMSCLRISQTSDRAIMSVQCVG